LSHTLTLKILTILASVAALTFCGRKKWLRPGEVLWVGVALVFWATGWLLATLVKVTVDLYGHTWRALAMAAAIVFPMTLALSVSLRILVRRLRLAELADKQKALDAGKSQPKASEIRKKK
jgi:hypothetical protein